MADTKTRNPLLISTMSSWPSYKRKQKKMSLKKENTSSISENVKKLLLVEKKNYVAARSSTLQDGVVEKILKDLQTNHQLDDPEKVIAILAMLFQQGGTARSCDGNMSVTLFDITAKLADVRKVLKTNSCNKAERKLARSIADKIFEVAKIMDIPGNLYVKIQKQNLERAFTDEEKIWLSDFQADNENCPIALRKLIQETFKKKTGK